MRNIEFDNDALAKLQQELNARAQDVVRKVNAEMAGQPTDEVLDTLRNRIRAAGMEPKDEGLRPAAAAISNGTLIE